MSDRKKICANCASAETKPKIDRSLVFVVCADCGYHRLSHSLTLDLAELMARHERDVMHQLENPQHLPLIKGEF